VLLHVENADMSNLHADVAIIGSGFGGTLTALILERIGLRPVLIDRDSHPRLVLGESSTPLADMLLASLARKYGLPRIAPLAEFGSWQREYPNLACGLKRGFSYFGHVPGQAFEPRADHANEMLVAASFAAEDADAHWFRPDFDAFLVREAQTAKIPFFDRTVVTRLSEGEPWRLDCRRGDETLAITADFLIDGSGAGGFIAQQLAIPLDPHLMRTTSRALYGHFTGVKSWDKILMAAEAKTCDHTFPCDDAALHQILDGGWMYVLGFNNGVTSAGFMIDSDRYPLDSNLAPEDEWRIWLDRYPSVAEQFSRAEIIPMCGKLRRTPRLQRRARRTVGPNWAMLPLAAYTLDALHSSGNAHTLYGIERLASIFERRLGREEFYAALQEHARILQQEIDLIDQLVHGCYRAFADFDLFVSFAMFYFAAAHNSEDQRRRGRAGPGSAFLLADNSQFRQAIDTCYDRLFEITADGQPSVVDVREFRQLVTRSIEPFNIAGLCDESRHNMYPFIVCPAIVPA
jgi:FADH2 O2-dependent halogenase